MTLAHWVSPFLHVPSLWLLNSSVHGCNSSNPCWRLAESLIQRQVLDTHQKDNPHIQRDRGHAKKAWLQVGARVDARKSSDQGRYQQGVVVSLENGVASVLLDDGNTAERVTLMQPSSRAVLPGEVIPGGTAMMEDILDSSGGGYSEGWGGMAQWRNSSGEVVDQETVLKVFHVMKGLQAAIEIPEEQGGPDEPLRDTIHREFTKTQIQLEPAEQEIFKSLETVFWSYVADIGNLSTNALRELEYPETLRPQPGEVSFPFHPSNPNNYFPAGSRRVSMRRSTGVAPGKDPSVKGASRREIAGSNQDGFVRSGFYDLVVCSRPLSQPDIPSPSWPCLQLACAADLTTDLYGILGAASARVRNG